LARFKSADVSDEPFGHLRGILTFVLILPALGGLATRSGGPWGHRINPPARLKRMAEFALLRVVSGTMASTPDVSDLHGSLAPRAPAALKEFVERDALAARPALEAALAKQPNAVNLWEALVWTFVLTSDTPMVIETARRALARSSSPNLYLWLGIAHLQRGENDQALAALQRAAQLKPTALAADALGRCLHRLGRTDEAIGVLDRAVRSPEAAG